MHSLKLLYHISGNRVKAFTLSILKTGPFVKNVDCTFKEKIQYCDCHPLSTTVVVSISCVH